MRHALEPRSDHLFVRLDARAVLLDTGSPTSFGAGGALVLGGRTFPLPPAMPGGPTLPYLSDKLGEPVHALLGMDVLGQFSATLDIPRRTLELRGPREPERAPLVRRVAGLPVARVEVGGEAVECIVDTGARVTYLDERIALAFPEDGRMQDFHPVAGDFQVNRHVVEFAWGDERCVLRPGALRLAMLPSLEVAKVRGILGLDWISGLADGLWL